MMWRRLWALIVKELLAVLRDPRGRFILIGPPLMQMFLFSYAATLDVSNIDVGVLNRDAGRWSVEFLQQLQGAPAFRHLTRFANQREARDAIDNRRVIATLHFGPDFSRDVEAGRPAEVQIVLDGRRSNASQIVLGYVSAIASGIATPMQVRTAFAGAGDAAVPPIAVRHWFNAKSRLYYGPPSPGPLGTLGLLIALVLTANRWRGSVTGNLRSAHGVRLCASAKSDRQDACRR